MFSLKRGTFIGPGELAALEGALRTLDTPAGTRSSEVAKHFITERTRAHEKYIKETETTRRIYIYLATILLIFACVIPVFAPPGREPISYFASLTLLIFSAGAAGYTTIRIREKGRQLVLSDKSSIEDDVSLPPTQDKGSSSYTD
jgi:hypothetical protein